MPWSNIPKSKWPQMEKCVDELKAQGKSEASANAICYTSIMGHKKIDLPNINFNINLNDYWKNRMGIEEEEEIEELEGIEEVEKAVWTTAFINTLPDSSFAYVEPGEKDEEGKTIPRSKRHLPYKDASGKPDAAHVRNALARLNQTDIPAEAKASAKAKLVAAAKQLGIEVSDEQKIDSAIGEIKAEGGEQMTKQEEETLKALDPKMQACMTGHMKEGKSMKEAHTMCEKEMEGKKVAKQDEEVTEEKPAEEVIVEEAPASAEATAGEPVEKAVEEKPIEESPAEEAKEEAVVEAKPTEEVATADPVGDLLKQVLAKVDEIQASIKKEDSASTEGATETPVTEEVAEETAPEGGVAEAPVEEAPVESDSTPAGASTEGTEDPAPAGAGEEVAKISDSLTKIADSIATLEKRINALEEQPAPSKVVSPKVVTKGEEVGGDNPNQERLDEIKTELGKMEEMRDKDIDKYQKERVWEKAFSLIAERDRLLKA